MNPRCNGSSWKTSWSVLKRAWNSGPPRLEDFLTDPLVSRQVLLVELLHTDLEYRHKAGQAVRMEEYLQHFPNWSKPPPSSWS